MKGNCIREVKESITVKDYNKMLRILGTERSLDPKHINLMYKNGYDNVFQYDDTLQKWLLENQIDFRINWAKIIR